MEGNHRAAARRSAFKARAYRLTLFLRDWGTSLRAAPTLEAIQPRPSFPVVGPKDNIPRRQTRAQDLFR